MLPSRLLATTMANAATPALSQTLNVYNPATRQLLASLTPSSPESVDEAVRVAKNTFDSGIWSRAPAHQRAKVLSALSASLSAQVGEIAVLESQQTGRTLREFKAQLGRLPEWLEYFASLLRVQGGYVAPTQGPLLNYVQRIPLGVVAQITPFNHPLLIAVKKIAPALAAGNSVIVKPSEHAPLSVLRFHEMALEAGVPPGVLTVLTGGADVARQLVANPTLRKVDITAGTRTGQAVGSVVGANLASYTAELGGKAPIVVFDDADLVSAVNGVAFAAYIASGQTCVSGTRLILHEKLYDAFMEKFRAKVESITRRIGDPLNLKSMMGTVIHDAQLERLERLLSHLPRDSSLTGSTRITVGGARLEGASPLDGFDLSGGSFFAPTVIEDISTEDELWKEEVFGPVLVVKRFSNEEEAVSLANDCRYGLGAAMWTTNLSRAHRVSALIEAGLVWVNTHHRNDPSSPWGGMKESGIGRENGVEAYEAYSQSKSTIVNIADPSVTQKTDDWFAEDEGVEKRYG
ncbi:aldehyde dehydrogenase [Clavulina sp. PMI_390]|nr:aldehyde dehydrogenase [Clavulina sp. PMI_390]